MSDFIRDCMERWGGVNHDDLWKLFASSVVDNVNGAHVIRFLKEEHKDLRFGDAGNVEIEYLVEATFTNSYGATGEIDHALESMNGRDWRMACDAICTRLLKRHDANPDEFEWPCPDARVTYDWFEDEDDVTKTATLVWQVDERTWRWMNPDTVQEIRNEEGDKHGASPEDGKDSPSVAYVYVYYRERENGFSREIVSTYRRKDDALSALARAADEYVKSAGGDSSDLRWHSDENETWWAHNEHLDSDGFVKMEVT